MIELYMFEDCPYCQKVRRKCNELMISFIYHPQNPRLGQENTGFKIGGKTQVPLLVDSEKNVIMYESEDIIKYLEENYGMD
jgi:glutaredoxin 2